MTADRTLFPPGPATGGLTAKQETVLAILTDHGPLRAIDVGALLHQARKTPCACGPGRTCKWAAGDAGDVLRALRKRDLAIQRRSGQWELLQPPITGYDPKTADWPEGF